MLDNSKAKVEQNCTVIAEDKSFVKAYHNAQVTIYSDRASAEIRGEAIAFVYGSGIVQAFDKSIIKVPYGISPRILGCDKSIIITNSNIVKNIINCDDSITINRAASSRSLGKPSKAARHRKIQYAEAILGIISPQKLFSQPM